MALLEAREADIRRCEVGCVRNLQRVIAGQRRQPFDSLYLVSGMDHLLKNGVGANAPKKFSARNWTGFGLRNVEERLQTVYQGKARLSFESRPSGGSCARILIPIPAAA